MLAFLIIFSSSSAAASKCCFSSVAVAVATASSSSGATRASGSIGGARGRLTASRTSGGTVVQNLKAEQHEVLDRLAYQFMQTKSLIHWQMPRWRIHMKL
jgi:hypothetical protein